MAIKKGIESLMAAFEDDVERDSMRSEEELRVTLDFALKRAQEYATVLGMTRNEVLELWERNRDYWWLNYYQDANQPKLDSERTIAIVDDPQQFLEETKDSGYRCPKCGDISKKPEDCACGWKSYGLFGCLGKGLYFINRTNLASGEVFFPVAWEKSGIPSKYQVEN